MLLSVGLFVGLAPGSHAATPMQLTYQVTHSTFGNIGTYINTIEPSAGGATTVQTRAHFEVKMLGVTLHREDAQRTERWQGNRLISFSGVTNKGSGATVLKGEARGNNFRDQLAGRNDYRAGNSSSGQSVVGKFSKLEHNDAAG